MSILRSSRGIIAIASLLLATVTGSAAEPAMERRVLLDAASAPDWSAAESTLKVADAPGLDGQKSLLWHITVDHFGGEAKYPIGWPRIGIALKAPAARDWSGWDYLQFRIFTATPRQALPREPMGVALYTPDSKTAYRRTLDELARDQWVQIRIPLAEVPRHGDVRLIQFNISDSRYKHQDQLDFHIDQICLLRYARPTLLGFAPERAVMFADARQIPVRFDLTGTSPADPILITCELRRDGSVVATTKLQAVRGAQRIRVNLGESLPPGDYDLLAQPAGGEATSPARLRLVESPWAAPEKKP